MIRSYLDFALYVKKLKREGYFVQVNAGDQVANEGFDSPLTEEDTEALREADSARFVRDIESPPRRGFSARKLGQKLYESVFSAPVRSLLDKCLPAPLSSRGVRLRLHSDSPEVLRWPWEMLHNSVNFLALSHETPIVRHLPSPKSWPVLRTPYPLRILVVVPSPSGLTPLHSEEEIKEIRRALRWPIRLGFVKVERLATPTLSSLLALLGAQTVHVLHFIGHGRFDAESGQGVIFLEDPEGQPAPVSGSRLAAVLAVGQKSLRLVVLNSCEGAVGHKEELFAGVAGCLVGIGIPSVVAMQFPIDDRMAIVFSYWFYWALAWGRRVEWAVTRARIALRAAGEGFEWAVPVLFLSAPDGRLFRWRPSWPAVVSSISALLLGACGWLAIPRDNQIMESSDRMSPPPRYCRPPAALPGLKFILVYPGTFNMGSEAGEDDEKPVHQVTITQPFCLAERELTQEEWETIQGSASLRTEWRGDSLPVSRVSYDEVQEFLRELNEREGRAAFRLPTEAEWEYVASAPGAKNGNCDGKSEPVPVGSFPANALGFHDLIGNVWEMTGDWYGPYASGPVVDPKGPDVGEERVVRGGSFDSAEKHCRPTRRETRKPSSQFQNTGVRLVREIRGWSPHLK